ncbi:MAG TPA: hypothetical protein P5560_12250 [Thermotogota bacterium]|nr:hypothetical protein [Thermotogota bacterium]
MEAFFVFLLIFFPGVAASVYYLKIKKKPLASVEFPAFIVVFSFLVWLCNLAFQYFKGYAHQEIFNEGFFSIQYTVKYLLLSLVFSVLLPHVLCFLSFFEGSFDRVMLRVTRKRKRGEKE